MYQSHTTLRNNSKGRERCKTLVEGPKFCMVLLTKKQSEVGFRENAGVLHKDSAFLNVSIIHNAESVQLRTMFVLKILQQYITLIFFTTSESEEFISIGWCSAVTQFVLPLKMKPSRQGNIKTQSVLYSQIKLWTNKFRRSQIFSLYSSLCFIHRIYIEMIMKLRMIKTMHLIIFNNISLPQSHPLANLQRPQFKNPRFRENR